MTITRTLLFLFGIFILLLPSCTVSSDVISDRGIQKRKYRNGYFVVKPESKQIESQPQLSRVKKVHKIEPIVTETLTPELLYTSETTAFKEPELPRSSVHSDSKPIEEIFETEETNLQQWASQMMRHQPSLKSKKVENIASPQSDQELLLFLILAILLPWLAMILLYGVGKEFIISLLLWFVFLLPGIIYAVIMVIRKLG